MERVRRIIREELRRREKERKKKKIKRKAGIKVAEVLAIISTLVFLRRLLKSVKREDK